MAKRKPVTPRVKTDAELEAEHQAAMSDRFVLDANGEATPAPMSTPVDVAPKPPRR